jgi:hypothetical protein
MPQSFCLFVVVVITLGSAFAQPDNWNGGTGKLEQCRITQVIGTRPQ